MLGFNFNLRNEINKQIYTIIIFLTEPIKNLHYRYLNLMGYHRHRVHTYQLFQRLLLSWVSFISYCFISSVSIFPTVLTGAFYLRFSLTNLTVKLRFFIFSRSICRNIRSLSLQGKFSRTPKAIGVWNWGYEAFIRWRMQRIYSPQLSQAIFSRRVLPCGFL